MSFKFSSAGSRPSTPPPEPFTPNPLALQLVTRPPPTFRGVFTSPHQAIRPGTVVEVAPVLVLPQAEWVHGSKTALDHYAFVWGREGSMALAFGLGSMFNHSPAPNVSYIRDVAAQQIRFVASKFIPPSTELTISYGPESALWFAPDYGTAAGGGAAFSPAASDDEDGETALLRIAVALEEEEAGAEAAAS